MLVASFDDSHSFDGRTDGRRTENKNGAAAINRHIFSPLNAHSIDNLAGGKVNLPILLG